MNEEAARAELQLQIEDCGSLKLIQILSTSAPFLNCIVSISSEKEPAQETRAVSFRYAPTESERVEDECGAGTGFAVTDAEPPIVFFDSLHSALMMKSERYKQLFYAGLANELDAADDDAEATL